MKPDVRALALLLPLLLTSCAHKKQAQVQQPLAPPIEDTPPSPPNNAPANLPPPVITIPQQPGQQQQPKPGTPTAESKTPPKPVAHKHHKPAPKPDQAPSNTERAAANPPEVSAIGQLSSGEPSDLRKQASDSIASTEQKLNQIHRKLNDQEQKTAAQIREFLKQARAALASGDTDGAYTLALKAKVLLAELTQ